MKDALEELARITREATARTITATEAFRQAGEVIRREESRRRRRARYEIREAILARRLGIAPEPWRIK